MILEQVPTCQRRAYQTLLNEKVENCDTKLVHNYLHPPISPQPPPFYPLDLLLLLSITFLSSSQPLPFLSLTLPLTFPLIPAFILFVSNSHYYPHSCSLSHFYLTPTITIPTQVPSIPLSTPSFLSSQSSPSLPLTLSFILIFIYLTPTIPLPTQVPRYWS